MSKSVVLLDSAARVASPGNLKLPGNYATKKSNSNEIRVDQNKINNMHIIIDVTAIVTTPSIEVFIEAFDEASGKYYEILKSLPITTVTTNLLKVGKNMIDSANLSAQDFLTNDMRVRVAHANGDSITYSIGVNFEDS